MSSSRSIGLQPELGQRHRRRVGAVGATAHSIPAGSPSRPPSQASTSGAAADRGVAGIAGPAPVATAPNSSGDALVQHGSAARGGDHLRLRRPLPLGQGVQRGRGAGRSSP